MDVFEFINNFSSQARTAVVQLALLAVGVFLLVTFVRSRNLLGLLGTLLIGVIALWGMQNISQVEELISNTFDRLGLG